MRPRFERLEDGLAPWAARERDSRGRRYPEPEHEFRSPYQRDRDRIVHSTAFRRLEYKTQVFVNHEGDYYRTRLTHTLEVSQIARTIARALGLNEDLTEAVALAHDLGHTPFGHSGEEALNELMREHGGFEHNLHGLRVVDVLERRYPDFPGLNLTWEVREAFVRHVTPYDRPTDARGEFPPEETVHLEGQVVSAADAIAYNSHDLDDGLVSGLVSEADLRELRLWRRAEEAAGRASGRTGGRPGLPADAKLRRCAIVRQLINIQACDLIENSSHRIAESGVRSLADVRRCKDWLVRGSDELADEERELQRFLQERLYRHHRVMRMANKAKLFVEEIFQELVRHREDLPPEHRARIDEEREPVERVVCDYIAGMTDRYAQDAYKQLFHPYERM